MQVTETLADGLKRAYTVVLPGAAIESKRTARLTEIGKTLALPGFRPGKVPLSIVRKRYGAAVMGEVVEETVNEATRTLLAERGLRPATAPKVDLRDPKAPEAGADVDLEFTLEFEVVPEIALPDFAALALTRRKAEVAGEAIEASLRTLAERRRTLTDLAEDRVAARGDILVADYVGKIDGVAFAGGSATGAEIEVAGPGYVEGFTEQLEGLKPGEERDIEVRFPAEYDNRELAGKTARFAITARRLCSATVPAVDEEFAKSLGFEGESELREAVRGSIRAEYERLAKLRLKRDLLDLLEKEARFTAPEALVESEFLAIWARVQDDRKQGRLDEEDRGKDEESLRAEYRAIADRRVRLGLILAEIGRTHGLTVSNEEMNRAMRAEAGRYPGQEAQVMALFKRNPNAAEGLRGPIFENKVVDFVLELASVTEETVDPAALAEMPEEAAPAAATAAPAGGEVAGSEAVGDAAAGGPSGAA